MTDYTGAISHSQAQISDNDPSQHSPRKTIPTSSSAECVGFPTTPSNMILTTLDHPHNQSTPPSSNNTAKKTRGRPLGSKNKPKSPLVIIRECDSSAIKPVILEIASGSDIIDAILTYARRNHVGISIISVMGSVSNITLRHPVSLASPISLHGPFSLLSLSGSFVASTTLSSPPPNESSPSCSSPLSSNLPFSFGITVAGGPGQVFGGIVGGKVMAATQVIVVATTFVSPAFHRLACEGDNGGDDHRRQRIKPCNVGTVGTETFSSGGISMPVACSSSQFNRQIIPADAMPL